MSAEGMAFIAWICLMIIGAIIGTWVSKEERKDLSDAEYNEQQNIHKGGC